ncbi:hypothetical protein DOY81_014572 [Sarcophaga bullata]|nr:hypothetical protein DOY81_014572 [Sarcophaga bullata]
MFRQQIFLALFGLFICLCSKALAGSYGTVPAYQPVYNAPEYSYESADAAASAITDIAAAKASAAKINSVNRAALHKYGYEIGVPLLVKPYGSLTNLYAALAPKRSFVGTIDAGFFKDSYGKMKFADETAVGAIAI